MAAYNWIAVSIECPACRSTAEVRCQTHVASDYDGDEQGRFFDHVYRLGDTMKWWPRSDTRFRRWRADGLRQPSNDPSTDEEACCASCALCKAALYVVVRFEETRPVGVVSVGLARDWPKTHLA